jgi:uncharacterized membrane protein
LAKWSGWEGSGVATELHQAKRPVSLLAGPYGHPFHPVLVTVPIGAWVASFVFDLASRWSGEPLVFAKGAYWLVGLGVVGALVAATFGFLDLFAIPTGTRAFRTGLLHMAVNLVVVSGFAGSFLLRRPRLGQSGGVPIGLITLSAAALTLLAVAGWLGGQLAYRYGVRVADEATQADGYRTGRGPDS